MNVWKAHLLSERERNSQRFQSDTNELFFSSPVHLERMLAVCFMDSSVALVEGKKAR